ncbi:MAG: PilZ domain-containing protein [Candidatus Omnitrophota bacterium]
MKIKKNKRGHMEYVIAGACLVIGIIIGVFIALSTFESAAKTELRKRLESEVGREKAVSPVVQSRKAERRGEGRIMVEIKAPETDRLGLVAEGEINKFSAYLLDISTSGAGILCDRFMKKGLVIHMDCNYSDMKFQTMAEIKNSFIKDNGIRYGLQFLKPLPKHTL